MKASTRRGETLSARLVSEMAMRGSLSLLWGCALFGCGGIAHHQTSPERPPVVDLGGEQPTRATAGDVVPMEAESCSFTAPAWEGDSVTLHYENLGAYATFFRGDLRVRVGGDPGFAHGEIEVEGWKLLGGISLTELRLYLAQPLWLGGVVRPHHDAWIRARVIGSKLSLVAHLEVSPHALEGSPDGWLEVSDTRLQCEAVGLTPAGFSREPTSVEETALGGLTRWQAAAGSVVRLRGATGPVLGTLTLARHEEALELSRDGNRCRVLIELDTFAALGSTACTNLSALNGGRGTYRPSVRRRRRFPSVPTLRCTHDLPLFAQLKGAKGEAVVSVGSIRANTAIPIPWRVADRIGVRSPNAIQPSGNTLLFVTEAATEGGCQLTPTSP